MVRSVQDVADLFTRSVVQESGEVRMGKVVEAAFVTPPVATFELETVEGRTFTITIQEGA